MYNYILILFFFLSVSAGAQINDTARIINRADTLIADLQITADSLALTDTSAVPQDSVYTAPEIITPLYQKPLYSFSRFVSKNDFYRRSLVTSADIFSLTPFFFDISHGLSGYHNNTLIYGSGASSSSFLLNGLSINDYSDMPVDLNRIQTEYIDSVEVIPFPRGFLYGSENNLTTVNFIGRDFISAAPYTRIKYYEGPFGEAFVDGIFNSMVFSRFNLFFEMSNKKADIRYLNTDFGQWNARAQLKYILNNNINLISGYSYSTTNTGASGGIDIMNMTIDENGFYEALYNEISAPVIYPDLRYNTYEHSVFLKALGSFNSNYFTDASVYYRFHRFELNGTAGSSGYLDNLYKDKILGVSLNQDLIFNRFSFKLLANFESADVTDYRGFTGERNLSSTDINRLNIAAVFSYPLFDSLIFPSAFYKISREKIIDAVNYSGFGGDIVISLPSDSKIYAGYSKFKGRMIREYAENFQAGISYEHSNFRAGLSCFSRDGEINYAGIDTILQINSPLFYPGSIKGLSLDLGIQIHKILIEGKIDYYKETNRDLTSILPSSYISGGAYYKDSLFSGNLDLKAGFNISYYGRRNLNLTPQYFYLYQGNTAGPDFTLNFFVSGEIQKRAIVFFSWENLLDKKYFIVPFYPMPPRGVRFGVSWEMFN